MLWRLFNGREPETKSKYVIIDEYGLVDVDKYHIDKGVNEGYLYFSGYHYEPDGTLALRYNYTPG